MLPEKKGVTHQKRSPALEKKTAGMEDWRTSQQGLKGKRNKHVVDTWDRKTGGLQEKMAKKKTRTGGGKKAGSLKTTQVPKRQGERRRKRPTDIPLP